MSRLQIRIMKERIQIRINERMERIYPRLYKEGNKQYTLDINLDHVPRVGFYTRALIGWAFLRPVIFYSDTSNRLLDGGKDWVNHSRHVNRVEINKKYAGSLTQNIYRTSGWVLSKMRRTATGKTHDHGLTKHTGPMGPNNLLWEF